MWRFRGRIPIKLDWFSVTSRELYWSNFGSCLTDTLVNMKNVLSELLEVQNKIFSDISVYFVHWIFLIFFLLFLGWGEGGVRFPSSEGQIYLSFVILVCLLSCHVHLALIHSTLVKKKSCCLKQNSVSINWWLVSSCKIFISSTWSLVSCYKLKYVASATLV